MIYIYIHTYTYMPGHGYGLCLCVCVQIHIRVILEFLYLKKRHRFNMKRQLSICGGTMSFSSWYLLIKYLEFLRVFSACFAFVVPEQVALQHHLPEAERNQAACCEVVQVLQHLHAVAILTDLNVLQ